MSKLNKTKLNDLPQTTRETMVELLNARLADTMDLFNQTKQAHWNIKGPNFIALHELLDNVAEHFEEYSDMIAERCVILGGIAQGTTQCVGENTSIKEFPRDLMAQNPVIDTLTTNIADYCGKLRKAIDAADEVKDKDTADLFTEISRVIDKDLWFLEAHLYG